MTLRVECMSKEEQKKGGEVYYMCCCIGGVWEYKSEHNWNYMSTFGLTGRARCTNACMYGICFIDIRRQGLNIYSDGKGLAVWNIYSPVGIDSAVLDVWPLILSETGNLRFHRISALRPSALLGTINSPHLSSHSSPTILHPSPFWLRCSFSASPHPLPSPHSSSHHLPQRPLQYQS